MWLSEKDEKWSLEKDELEKQILEGLEKHFKKKQEEIRREMILEEDDSKRRKRLERMFKAENQAEEPFEERALEARIVRADRKRFGFVYYVEISNPPIYRAFVCYPDGYDPGIRELEEQLGVIIRINEGLLKDFFDDEETAA